MANSISDILLWLLAIIYFNMTFIAIHIDCYQSNENMDDVHDSIPSSKLSKSEEVTTEPAPVYNGLSCFICSTMHTGDACRNLRVRPLAMSSPHLHAASSPTQTSNNMKTTKEEVIANQSTSTAGATQSNLSQLETLYQNSNTSSIDENKLPVAIKRCTGDELFCSVTTIARLEFFNNTVVTRFWALERNCSKSCNNHCMLIGERVRIRACNRCCSTSNCNVGSGAAHSINALSRYQLMSLISIVIIVAFQQIIQTVTFVTVKQTPANRKWQLFS